jgi:amino acid transporter
MNAVNNTSVVFGWFVNITTVAGLIGWIVIEVTYLRFWAGLRVQRISRDGMYSFTSFFWFYKGLLLMTNGLELPYRSPLQPYAAWMTLLVVFLVVFFSGTFPHPSQFM